MTANQQLARSLATVRHADGWWVVGGEEPMGPYRTRAEADDDRRGVQRFLRNCHRRGFVTCDNRREN